MQVAHHNGNTRAEVLEIIREMPGLTSSEIASLMPHKNKVTVASTVFHLKQEGVIEVSGKKDTVSKDGRPKPILTYTLSTNPTPNVIKMKRKAPSEAALHMQIRELQQQITELQAWKAKAVEQYPDLAVEPVVLKARKLVAAELRASGDTSLAHHVEVGDKDTTLMMRVAIKALEEVE